MEDKNKFYVIPHKLINTVHKATCGILRRSKNIHEWDRDPTLTLPSGAWYSHCSSCFREGD